MQVHGRARHDGKGAVVEVRIAGHCQSCIYRGVGGRTERGSRGENNRSQQPHERDDDRDRPRRTPLLPEPEQRRHRLAKLLRGLCDRRAGKSCRACMTSVFDLHVVPQRPLGLKARHILRHSSLPRRSNQRGRWCVELRGAAQSQLRQESGRWTKTTASASAAGIPALLHSQPLRASAPRRRQRTRLAIVGALVVSEVGAPVVDRARTAKLAQPEGVTDTVTTHQKTG